MKNRSFRSQSILAIAILLLISIASLEAQQTSNTGVLKGKVYDELTMETLPYSNIYIEEIGMGQTSDEEGNFEIVNVPEGRYNVSISYVGYNKKSLTEVRISRNKIAFFEIPLSQNSFALDALEVKAYKFENLASMPISTFSMSREEIFRSPASNGNIFRAISTLPGVQSGGGSFAALAVRGQGTEENATFVDEFPVFELSHLAGGGGGFDDPNGGRFSIFGPRSVDALVLQTGGFSAEHGRRSSSYMELNIKEGNPEDSEIDAVLSLTGPSLSYTGHLGKVNIYSSLRYQNFVPALTLTGQAELGDPSFADLTLKLTSQLSEKHKLTVLALYNPERYRRTTENVVKDGNRDNGLENNFIGDVDNSKGLFGLKLKSLVNKKSNWTNLVYTRVKKTDTDFGLAYPYYSSDGQVPTAEDIPYNPTKGYVKNTEREIGLRSIFASQLNDKASLKSGVDIANLSIDHERFRTENDTIYSFYRAHLPASQAEQNYFILEPQYYNRTFKDNAFNFSGYFNILYHLNAKLSTNIGARYDYTGFSEKGVFSPRFNLNYKLSERTSFTFATGLFYQDPIPIFVADNTGAALEQEKAVHFILGGKHYLTEDLKFTAEAYHKSFSNLVARSNSNINELDNIGTGEAYGLDLSLVKRLSNKFNGLLSYSYSQSTRDDHDGIGVYDHLYSQPHIFNLLLGFQPNSNWIFSAKLRYSTGQPSNSSRIFENVFESNEFVRFGQELIGKHDIRNDDFIGIDLRIDRRIQLRKFAINAFLDIQNVTNRENAATRTFYEITGSYKPQALGILPTIGWRLEF